MENRENFKKSIKWACIQPLTGGLYLGTEVAIGHPAEWIMSFDGLAGVKKNKKTGVITEYANEYNLLDYLKKKGREVPYYVIKEKQFGIDINCTDPNITLNDEPAKPSFKDLDLIVALPVCSGLSTITNGSDEARKTKNCNMQFITNYTINVIKPKVFVFENAPGLMGQRAEYLREYFNILAKENGYSVLYYKTDTIFHDNCQKRARTFVIFVKHNTDVDVQNPPLFKYERKTVSIEEFLSRIPEGCTQTEDIAMTKTNYIVFKYVRQRFPNWRDLIFGNMVHWLHHNGYMQELIDFAANDDTLSDIERKRVLHYFDHANEYLNRDYNYFGMDIRQFVEAVPGVQFKSIPSMLHLKEDRLYNRRELMSFMGMPYDFEIHGDDRNLPKIGQNVPVRTMKFIVENVIDILKNWNNDRATVSNSVYQNNIHTKVAPETSGLIEKETCNNNLFEGASNVFECTSECSCNA